MNRHLLLPTTVLLLLWHTIQATTSISSTTTATATQATPPSNLHRRAVVREYYSSPRYKYTHTLGSGRLNGPSTASLRRGNAIVTSADGQYLFVTSDDGTLHIVHAHHPGVFDRVYDPTSDVLEDAGWFTFCQSGVSLFHTRDRMRSVVFAVYAVVDLPPRNSVHDEKSRIIAVDHKGNLLWSRQLSGVAVGTPQISQNGRYVYLTHNLSHEQVGRFTALDANNDGVIIFSEGNVNIRPYGPMTVSRVGTDKTAVVGAFAAGGDSDDDMDVLYFGETPDRGYDFFGAVHKVSVSRRGVITSGVLPQTRWSTATAPTVSEDGRRLWISGRDAWIRGVTADIRESVQMLWKTDLDHSLRNRTAPLYNRATLSPDEQYLYVASASTSFFCLDANTGNVIWKTDEDDDKSIYLTEAKVSYDNTKVYTIKHNDGTVTQHDAVTGDDEWTVDCTEFSDDRYCQDSVEAEFSISPDGSTLYYGDIFGKIVALTIGKTPEPTPLPSSMPTISTIPTSTPTDLPTLTAAPTDLPTVTPTVSPTDLPTVTPTISPTELPTVSPTALPSPSPSVSALPSYTPSTTPTVTPTKTAPPTVSPSVGVVTNVANVAGVARLASMGAVDVVLVSLALTITVIFSILFVVLVTRVVRRKQY